MSHRSITTSLVVGDGDVPSRAVLDAAWPGWSASVGWVVAADGGALRAEGLGLRPDFVIGDLDSLPDEAVRRLAAAGVPIERHPVAKDASDLELAVLAATARHAGPLVILGALGGPRLDHALAAVWLLALPRLRRRPTTILDAHARLRLLRGPGTYAVDGRPGDLVTLLPFGGPARGVRTDGLAWPLRGETLTTGPSRGLSNRRPGARASIELASGHLLLVESHPL